MGTNETLINTSSNDTKVFWENDAMDDVRGTTARTLQTIAEYIQQHKYAPTVREIASLASISSTSTVYHHLQKLLKAGMIETDHGFGTPRALRISTEGQRYLHLLELEIIPNLPATKLEWNGKSYNEGDVYEWTDAAYNVTCTGIIKYGFWEQDGSSDEYPRISCYGWYVELLSIESLEDFDTTIEDYPSYYRTQSLLLLEQEKSFHIKNN